MLKFVLLLSASLVLQAKNLEEIAVEPADVEEKPVTELIEEYHEDDRFSVQSTTTTESTRTTETYKKLPLAVIDANNVSREFKPSIHLGEIKESRISTGPFNDLHHIRLENGIESVPYQRSNNIGIVHQPGHSIQTEHQASVDEDGREQNVYVKFQDVPRFHYGDPIYHQQLAENIGTQYDLIDQQVYQNLEKPDYLENFDDHKQSLGKPSKFQGDAQKHESESYPNVDPSKGQYYPGFYDQQGLDGFQRPHDGAVYVQESSFTRTKKFPYPFHQPPVGYHQVEIVNEQHSGYPVRERVSPWKKILRLIGAFLPIGLLVAALTPNIVKVNNTTDPNIVLSKWRIVDLPAEHKQARLNDFANDCEERSICETILAGGEAGSNAMQNILWNLATRTSTTIAIECGLQEIFDAVKKKDCTTIVC